MLRAQTPRPVRRIGALLAGLCCLALVALAQPTESHAGDRLVVEVGTVAPKGTPWSKFLKKLKKKLTKKLGGKEKVKFKVFLGGVRGGEKSLVRECRAGRIHMVGVSSGALASAVPAMNLLELPYLFDTLEEVDHILDNVIFDDMVKAMAERGFVMRQWSENGWRSFALREGIVKTPADLAGKKMRAQESDVHVDMYKALGASPVTISVPEVLGALQQGTVDGFDNTPLFAFAASWHQGIKAYSQTRHIYQPGVILYSKKWFDTLPKETQEGLLGTDMTQWGRDSIRKLDAGYEKGKGLLANYERAGVKVHINTPEERAAFRKVLMPVHDKWKKDNPKYAPLYDKVVAALKEFRAKK